MYCRGFYPPYPLDNLPTIELHNYLSAIQTRLYIYLPKQKWWKSVLRFRFKSTKPSQNKKYDIRHTAIYLLYGNMTASITTEVTIVSCSCQAIYKYKVSLVSPLIIWASGLNAVGRLRHWSSLPKSFLKLSHRGYSLNLRGIRQSKPSLTIPRWGALEGERS